MNLNWITETKFTRIELVLVITFLLGLFLRLYHLGTDSIWSDEWYSIWLARHNVFDIVNLTSVDVHPPLYYLILHYFITVFGDTELSTRLLSMVFGLCSIFMIYVVGSQIFNKEVGLLSSLLLAVSPVHIAFSQEVRMYTLICLLALLSMCFFLRLLEQYSLKASLGYVLSSALLIYSHVFGLFIIIAQNIYFLAQLIAVKERPTLKFKIWIVLQGTLLSVYALWVPNLINQAFRIQQSLQHIPAEAPSIDAISSSLLFFSSDIPLLFSIFLILSLFSIITYEKSLGRIDRKNSVKPIENYRWHVRISNLNPAFFLLTWLLTPIILPLIISNFFTPIYYPRFAIAASLALYILVAKGISNLHSQRIKRAVILVIIIVSLVYAANYYSTVYKPQFRESLSYINNNAKSGDLILLFNPTHYQEIVPLDYYVKRTDVVKQILPGSVLADINAHKGRLLAHTNGHHRVWIVLVGSNTDPSMNDEQTKQTFSKSYNLSYCKIYYSRFYASDIQVLLFKRAN